MNRLAPLLLLASLACTESNPAAPGPKVEEAPGDTVPYGEADEVVSADGRTFVVSETPESGAAGCVEIADDCVDLAAGQGRYCDDAEGRADVAVEDGEVVAAVADPDSANGAPVEEVTERSDGSVALPQNANGVVLVFDEATDGTPIEGDVVLDGERVTVWGNGRDQTVFAGDLTVSSNNGRVRGVTVRGDLTVTSNNVGLSHCRVGGDLVVEGNGFTAIECEVLGAVRVSGNGARLAYLKVAGEWTPGRSATCAQNHAFEDADDDGRFDDGELGDPLTCGG